MMTTVYAPLSDGFVVCLAMSIGQPRSHSPALTATAIERLLAKRIHDGMYVEGARLPTVREMAEALGVNKNTIVRAYQALERKGYLELTRGRGAFVRQIEPRGGSLDSRWLERLDHLLDDAKSNGLSRELVLHEITRGMDRKYGPAGLRMAFAECNQPDIDEMGTQLRAAVGRPFEGVLLADVLAHSAEIAQRFDLLVTTFYHLSEVIAAVQPASREKVVGIQAMPGHDALLNIARLHGQVIGLVCDRSGTMDNLTHIIRTYHQSATIMPALIDDQSRLQTLLRKADAIVATRSCYEQLMNLQPTAPVVMVVFTIEQQSIDFLHTQIEEREAVLSH